MSFAKALALGALTALVATVALLFWGLIAGGEVHIPHVVDVASTQAGTGSPGTSMSLSPLAPVLMSVAVAVLLWTVGRWTGRRHGGH